MGKYFIVVEKAAQKEIQEHYRSGDQASIKKLEKIFDDLAQHPETGIGQPEKLKYSLSEYWARKINKKDRLVYKIAEETVMVTVVASKGHYGDK